MGGNRRFIMVSDYTYCHRCGNALREEPVAGRTRPKCESCGAVVFLDPKLAVVVVASQDSRILMVKRDIDPMMGRWSFPSGYVDRGEVVEEAAVREVREETHVDVSLDRLLGVYSRRGAPVVVVAFAAKITGGRPAAGDEAQDVRLFAADGLPPLPFPNDDEIMSEWRRQYGEDEIGER